MTKRTAAAFLLLMWVLLISGGFAAPQKTESLKNTILVFYPRFFSEPCRTSVLPFAVDEIIETVVALHSGFDSHRNDGQTPTFNSWRELEEFNSGKDIPIPDHVDWLGYRYYLTSEIQGDYPSISVAIKLRDRVSGTVHSKELPLDFPAFLEFREGFISILNEAGGPVTPGIQTSMLWPEQIPAEAFVELAIGIRASMLRIGDPREAAKATVALDHALTLAPKSYLVLQERSKLYLQEHDYGTSQSLARKALAINPNGIDALELMLESSLILEGKKASKKWAARLAAAMGLPPGSWELLYLEKKAAVEEDPKNVYHIYEKLIDLQPDALGYKIQLISSLLEAGKLKKAEGIAFSALDLAESTGQQDRVFHQIVDCAYAWKSDGKPEKGKEIVLRLSEWARDRDDNAWAVACLRHLSSFEQAQGNTNSAIGLAKQALDLAQPGATPPTTAIVQIDLAILLSKSGELDEALLLFEEALKHIDSPFGNIISPGNTINIHFAQNELADAFMSELRYPDAYQMFEDGLESAKASIDLLSAAYLLSRLSLVSSYQGQLDRAIQEAQEAVSLADMKDHPLLECICLLQLGTVFQGLGSKNESFDCYRQALELAREHDFKEMEFSSHLRLGALQQDNKQAEKHFKKVLTMVQRAAKRNIFSAEEADGWLETVYYSLGRVNLRSENYNEANRYFTDSLALARKWDDLAGEGFSLFFLGKTHDAQGEGDTALELWSDAMVIGAKADVLQVYAYGYPTLMDFWARRGQPRLAIFYGKIAVNAVQQMRSNIEGMDSTVQKTFAEKHDDTYRQLSALLIGEGRLSEAQLVIDQLKREEYSKFARRASSDVPNSGQTIFFSPEEKMWNERFQQISDRLGDIAKERGKLMAKELRDDTEEERLTLLEDELDMAGRAFEDAMVDLEASLTGSPEGERRLYEVEEAQGLMEDLRDLGNGTVAIYTVVAQDDIHLILITPDFQKAVSVEIDRNELAQKVFAFRQTITSPDKNPIPLAQELYDILIRPITGDLEQIGAKTIMWSLDGVLRYIPVAALHSGEVFLIEQYNTVVFTPASHARLKDERSASWIGLGLGVSMAHEKFVALPGVREELGHIFRKDDEVDDSGSLSGSVFLDEEFTLQTMRRGLRKRPQIVHLATHFSLQPGDIGNSHLLLGDGSVLSLAEMRRYRNLFGGVELLTLSACNTASMGERADGREVEGFGVLAQRQGARSVIASLWSVSDQSTQILMEEFYRRLSDKTGDTKIGALREAQLSLLKGKNSAPSSVRDERGVTLEPLDEDVPGADFSSSQGQYSHPYYWAPFILIGNWK